MLEKLNLRRVAVFGGVSTTLIAGVLFMAGGSYAVGEDPAGDGIASLQASVLTYGTAVVALVLVAAGIFLGVKYLKKALSHA
jgi:hypothetical protein